MSTPNPHNSFQSSDPAKSWQARISEATDAIAQEFVESISYDWRMYKQDIAGSIAHATMLAKVGLITDGDREAIVKGLREIELEIDRDGAKWAGFKKELEDLHMCVESELTNRIGEPGRRLHTGRSRNDQVALDLVLWIHEAAGGLWSQLRDLQQAFVLLASKSMGIVMPSYTHVQRAQPILAAAEALAWCSMLERDVWRADKVNSDAKKVVPLGSGAIAGTSLGLDKSETVRLLAMPACDDGRNIDSSIELTASRDLACDLIYACAMVSQHLSRWAEQWIMYMSTEFSFIKIADRYTTSSSMMPQKKNPDMLELIRGRCGNVYGDLFALMTILKGLPIGYNRDLQEDKRIVFRAYDTVSQCLVMATAIVNTAEFQKQNIEPTLNRGFLDATSLAEYLVTLGMPFRTAHHIVGTLVAVCEKRGIASLGQLKVEEFNEVIASKSDLRVDADVYNCLGAANVVKRYQSAGAAGGKPLDEQLKMWKQRLDA